MTKKEFGKKSWNGTKAVIGIGVGFATGVVTNAICEAYAPAGTAPLIRRVVYTAGSKGLSMVTGALATNATLERLDKCEEKFLKRKESKESVVMEVIED